VEGCLKGMEVKQFSPPIYIIQIFIISNLQGNMKYILGKGGVEMQDK